MNTQPTSNADEYSTPIPQGASLGASPSAADDYSTPIPQGATVGAPAATNGTPSVSADALNLPGNLNAGALHGMAQTGAGAIELAQKMTPAGVIASSIPGVKGALDTAKNWLDQHSQNTGTDSVSRFEQGTGNVIEGLGEFLLGDEVLKGASLSERLLTSGKIAKTIESSPRLAAVVKAGLQALGRGAALGGAQGAVKSGGDPGATIGGAVAGGVGNVLVPGAVNAARAVPDVAASAAEAVRNAFKPGAIQDAFQGQIRDILNDAAREYGVQPSAASSIRDVANDISNALESKAKSAYQALDDAMGGKAQRFKEAIQNVQQKIRALNGVDPDQEGAYVEKLNDLQDAHDKAMDEATNALNAQGKDQTAKQLLDQANSDFRKSKAVADLSKNIRASVDGTGLRPEYAGGVKKAIPEKVDTKGLLTRLNKMDNANGTAPSRLNQALGADRSKAIMQAANDSHLATTTAQNIRNLAGSALKYGAIGIPGLEIVRHLLGE